MLAKRSFYIKSIIAVGLVLGVGLLVSTASMAQSTGSDGTSSAANAMKITPLRTDVTAEQGETATVEVKITNPSNGDVVMRPVQNDFKAADEDGSPAIILDETEYAESHSLKRFMQPLSDVSVPAGETVSVNVAIVIPNDAEPGGYYGVVRFVPSSPDSGGQVNTSISAASLILLTVAGDAPEKLNLTDFVVRQDGRVGSFFTNADNIDIMARFQNTGNIHAGPFGKLQVTKGDSVVYEADFNEKNPRDVILPDSARRWNIPVDKVSGFGKYNVKAVFSYGLSNQTIEVEQSFWVVPLPIIIVVSVILLAVIATVVVLILRARSKKNNVTL